MDYRVLKYHLLALATVAVWGASFICSRVLLDAGITPIALFVYRFALAYVGLLACSRFRVRVARWRDELRMALLGVTGGAAYFIAQNLALQHTLVSDVAVLVGTNPLFTIGLSALVLRGERLTWLQAAGSLVAFVGMVLLTFRGGFVWGDSLRGDLYALLGAVAWAVYTVLLKGVKPDCDTLTVTRKTFFYGVVAALPFAMLEPGTANIGAMASAPVVANLLFLALICSMAAFFAWSVVTRHVGPVAANNYLYLEPVVSVFIAAAALGERVGMVGAVAAALVIAGVVLAERG